VTRKRLLIMRFRRAERLQALPPYLFVEMDRAKNELTARGVDVVNLGIGDPDLPTFPEIVEALQVACSDSVTHCYPSQRGELSLRTAFSEWYRARYNVKLDPEREVLTLIGTKEGLGHLPVAALDPGRMAIVPDPGYPVYQSASWLAGGEIKHMPLEAELGFKPDFDGLSRESMDAAQLMFLNYPNNPTGASADEELFQFAVNLAHEHDFLCVNDAAYSEILFEGERHSILEAGGARDVAIEFHSLSKTFNMTGWRVGFAIGNEYALDALAEVKSNMDSGVFTAIQMAAEVALGLPEERVDEQVQIYRRRRDVLLEGLRGVGWNVSPAHATFYVWAHIPTGEDSMAFSSRLLEEAHVVTTPGVGFGPSGEGYVRMALTAPEDRIAEAVDRIGRML
jgi:LL-diaminopimelate aminotransferase